MPIEPFTPHPKPISNQLSQDSTPHLKIERNRVMRLFVARFEGIGEIV